MPPIFFPVFRCMPGPLTPYPPKTHECRRPHTRNVRIHAIAPPTPARSARKHPKLFAHRFIFNQNRMLSPHGEPLTKLCPFWFRVFLLCVCIAFSRPPLRHTPVSDTRKHPKTPQRYPFGRTKCRPFLYFVFFRRIRVFTLCFVFIAFAF